MGNTVVWKPAVTQRSRPTSHADFQGGRLAAGVINFVPGHGHDIPWSPSHPDLAGVHFTGSTAVFHRLWQIGANIASYRCYPRIVGETGGKDFMFAHPSADPEVLRTAMVRGAFEYQGQKCSAASRAYIPRSVWVKIRQVRCRGRGMKMGDVTDCPTSWAP